MTEEEAYLFSIQNHVKSSAVNVDISKTKEGFLIQLRGTVSGHKFQVDPFIKDVKDFWEKTVVAPDGVKYMIKVLLTYESGTQPGDIIYRHDRSLPSLNGTEYKDIQEIIMTSLDALSISETKKI